jgi:uncharacterized membrane protein
MPAPAPVRSTAAVPAPPAARSERSPRWHSLDVVKGIALFAMVAHHFQGWAAGPVKDRFIGFDEFIVTDLAAPLFAVGLGAAAVVVGDRVRTWRDLLGPARRWAEILVVGLVIDLVTHGAIEGRGVLPTLAILGLTVTVAVATGVRAPWVWWAAAAACAFAAVPASHVAGDDPLHLLVSGPFALPTYGVFAAAGAGVATHSLGRSERELPLVRSALGVLAAGLVANAAAGGAVAPRGLWTPARYPGHLGFTLWGLVASLLIWAVCRSVLRPGLLGSAIARAGRRTLWIFAGHFLVKVALRQAGLLGDLDTWRWGLVTWAAVVLVCIASTLPRPVRRGSEGPVHLAG